jgi:hypothetical protein
MEVQTLLNTYAAIRMKETMNHVPNSYTALYGTDKVSKNSIRAKIAKNNPWDKAPNRSKISITPGLKKQVSLKDHGQFNFP